MSTNTESLPPLKDKASEKLPPGADGNSIPVPPVVEWGSGRLPGGLNNGRPHEKGRALGELFGNSERAKWVPERSIKQNNDLSNVISSRMTAFELFSSGNANSSFYLLVLLLIIKIYSFGYKYVQFWDPEWISWCSVWHRKRFRQKGIISNAAPIVFAKQKRLVKL